MHKYSGRQHRKRTHGRATIVSWGTEAGRRFPSTGPRIRFANSGLLTHPSWLWLVRFRFSANLRGFGWRMRDGGINDWVLRHVSDPRTARGDGRGIGWPFCSEQRLSCDTSAFRKGVASRTSVSRRLRSWPGYRQKPGTAHPIFERTKRSRDSRRNTVESEAAKHVTIGFFAVLKTSRVPERCTGKGASIRTQTSRLP